MNKSPKKQIKYQLTSVDGIIEEKDKNEENDVVEIKDKKAVVNNKNVDEEKEKKKEKEKTVSLIELFRYATRRDVSIMILGTVCALGSGAIQPIMFILFGEMTNSFIEYAKKPENFTENQTAIYQKEILDKLLRDMKLFSINYAVFGAATFIMSYVQFTSFLSVSYRQSYKIRVALFNSLMKQDITWYDTHDTGELNTRLTDDINKIQEGTGDKLGMIFQGLAMFIGGFLIGFLKGWKLTLVILGISPILAIFGGIMAKLMSVLTKKELDAYSKAGSVAEEVISSIRTVTAFNGQEKELERYGKNLVYAKEFGIKKGLATGSLMGAFNVVVFAMMALAFWYGGKLVRDENFPPGTILTVFFSVLIGAFAIGMMGPNMQLVSTAQGASYTVFNIIDRRSQIDSTHDSGEKPSVKGNIEFRGVHFKYPSRPDVTILNGVSFKVPTGKTVALVGSSGCGKSTTVQLIQRFYDPEMGTILVDGHNIKEMNVNWLRRQIGVVSQEPILFATTIKENIRYGREDVTDDEIIEATKEANAYNFIEKLPDKFETLVGERGTQLSGGQKQRVAIARALVRKPLLLLLDEATSALDTESEAIVQDALNKASSGRTTIVIAHRLSTIRNADLICAFEKGKIVEEGTHDELMKKIDGIYYKLVMAQSNEKDEDDDDVEGGAGGGGGGVGKEISDVDGDIVSRQISQKSVCSSKDALKKRYHMKSTDSQDVNSSSHYAKLNIKTSEDNENNEKTIDSAPMDRIFKMNSPETLWIIFGSIGALGAGSVQPLFAVLLGDILNVFAKPFSVQSKEIAFYCGMMVVVGAGSGIMKFLQDFALGVSGERLTMRLRKVTFKAVLRQDISYFDETNNSTGALTTRLATDASAVQGATGGRLGTITQSFGTLGIGVILGFIYSWKMTLVLLLFTPFLILGGALEMFVMMGSQMQTNKALEEAGKISTQCIENIRTVAQLCKEKQFTDVYRDFLGMNHLDRMKKAHLIGLGFGLSQSVLFFAFAASFSFGAYLIKEDGIPFDRVFKVFSAVVFGSQAMGELASFSPSYGKAKVSAARLFRLFDRQPEIDSYDNGGKRLSEIGGVIEIHKVRFNYKNRPTIPILRGLKIRVEPGQTVALVGSSGCGKSTVVSLLERFYDPLVGFVTIDGHNIRDLNLNWLRQQIGFVQQEPVLFGCTIGENIAYGDTSRNVSMDEIILAAKEANIHNFIVSLPLSYDTPVGDKGTQLSGGQKQRIAIARALVRNPKILLLDEATSALDSESEIIVQEALDKARKGRTCITIAHRLSTIRNADCIIVIENGKVSELGKHNELMELKKFYYKLVQTQERNTK